MVETLNAYNFSQIINNINKIMLIKKKLVRRHFSIMVLYFDFQLWHAIMGEDFIFIKNSFSFRRYSSSKLYIRFSSFQTL